MKKILTVAFLTAALLISSVGVSAAATVSGTYDGGLVNSSSQVRSEYRADLSTTFNKFTLDVGAVGLANNTTRNGAALEANVGYQLPTLLTVETSVSAGLGHRFYSGATGSYYYVAQFNAKKQLTSDFAVVAGYRYRDGLKSVTPGTLPIRDSRGQVGFQLDLTKRVSTQVLYTHTQYDNNVVANGALVSVAYKL